MPRLVGGSLTLVATNRADEAALDAPGLSGGVSRWLLLTELTKLLWMPPDKAVASAKVDCPTF